MMHTKYKENMYPENEFSWRKLNNFVDTINTNQVFTSNKQIRTNNRTPDL